MGNDSGSRYESRYNLGSNLGTGFPRKDAPIHKYLMSIFSIYFSIITV